MGKPLILKGFWNVRRLKKYRQKKLKIGRECGKSKKILCKLSEKYKMKAVETTEKQEYLFKYSCFFFKNSIIHVGCSYLRNNILDILALDDRIYEAKKMLTASSTCSGASI